MAMAVLFSHSPMHLHDAILWLLAISAGYLFGTENLFIQTGRSMSSLPSQFLNLIPLLSPLFVPNSSNARSAASIAYPKRY